MSETICQDITLQIEESVNIGSPSTPTGRHTTLPSENGTRLQTLN